MPTSILGRKEGRKEEKEEEKGEELSRRSGNDRLKEFFEMNVDLHEYSSYWLSVLP